MIEFLKNNFFYIIILSLLIFGSFVIFNVIGDKFKDVLPLYMIEFLEKNLLYIIILSIIIFGSLVIFDVIGDKFKDVPPYLTKKKGTTRKVQVEAFKSLKDSSHICKNRTGQQLNEFCGNQNEDECETYKCCVFADGYIEKNGEHKDYKKCVSGKKKGPTFHSIIDKNGNRQPISFNYWWYQGECYEGEGDKKCPKSKTRNSNTENSDTENSDNEN